MSLVPFGCVVGKRADLLFYMLARTKDKSAPRFAVVHQRPTVSELMKLLFEGDHGKALCEYCQKVVTTTYVRRTAPFSDGHGEAKSILAGVCDVCDTIVAIPAQSAPVLKEAGKHRLTSGKVTRKVGKEDRGRNRERRNRTV